MPVRLSFNDIQKSEIIAAYAANCSFAKMEEKFRVSGPVLRKYLKEWGVYKDKTRNGSRKPDEITFNEEETAIIFEMYKKGENIPKIAHCVCVRPITLSAFLKSKGMFMPRRNKDYKLGITDEKIREVFERTRSIRTTARELGGLNQKSIKATLLRLGVKDPTHHEIYARIENQKIEIIALYQQNESLLPDICQKFDISKNILRVALKKWGVYDVRKHPSLVLVKAKTSKEVVVDTYHQLRSITAVVERLGLSFATVTKTLKQANVDFYPEKGDIIEKDKDVIVHRYTILHETCRSIAKDYSVWPTTIWDALKRWGVKIVNHKNEITRGKLEANKERICDLYENRGYALREIAEEFGVGHQTVIRAVKRWGLTVPDNRFKESSLERKFKKMLVGHEIAFTQFKQIRNRIYDFYLPSFNLIVECNGDYWHGHPRVYPQPDKEQIKGHKRDIVKNKLAREAGYQIYFIWESEINNAQDLVAALLRKLITGEAPINQSSPMDFLTERPELNGSHQSSTLDSPSQVF